MIKIMQMIIPHSWYYFQANKSSTDQLIDLLT